MITVAVKTQLGALVLDLAFTSDAAVTAIVGASGAGKTVLLRVIAGLLRPTQGRIEVGGRVLLDTAQGINLPPQARHVGYVFQHHALFPHLDVAGNVAFGLHGLEAAARTQRVAELLAQVSLTDAAARCDGLSGGERQRVALARALAPRPGLLLLDEPFASVDVPLRRRLREVVASACAESQAPALLVTHDPEDARALAQHVVVLDRGRVVASGGHEVLRGG